MNLMFIKRFPISCLFLFMAFSISCKKDHASPPVNGNDTIIGSWELRRIDGAQNPYANPNYPAGNGTIWKFTPAGYQFYIHGQLTDSGQYTIIQTISPVTGQSMNKLIFNADYSRGLFFQI